MEKSWNDYYINHTFRYSNVLLHFPYLLEIFKSNPKKMLEIGCGPADHSLFVKRFLPRMELYLLDLDKALLDRVYAVHTKEISGIYNVDILDTSAISSSHIPRCDVIISQGLMEHFPDEQFRSIVTNFSSYAPRMIFSVPSNEYPTRDFGNEILRSEEEWKTLLQSIPGINFRVQRYIDIGLQTKLLKIKMRSMSPLEALGYILFGSNHFVVTITYENPI